MADIIFSSEMDSALNRFENDLMDSVYHTIKNSKNGITYKVIDSIRDNTRRQRAYLADNISDGKIEEKMSDYLDKLRSLQSEHIEKTRNSIRQLTDSVIRLASRKNGEDLESAFITLTNEVFRKENASIYTELNNETSKQMKNYVSSCFLYSPAIEETMDDVSADIRRLLNNYCENLVREYQAYLNSYLKRYRGHILEAISNQQSIGSKENDKVEEQYINRENEMNDRFQNKTMVSANEMQFIAPSLKKYGIIIEDTFDGITIKAPNSEKAMTLYKGERGCYFSEDHSIEIESQTDDLNSNSMVITIGDNVITENVDSCYLGTKQNPKRIGLKMGFLEYQVFYGGVEQTDLIKMGVILDEIAKSFPEYYNSLSHEVIFESLQQKIEEAKREKNELYKDDYGIVHINPDTQEEFIDKVSAIGYALEEREDGVYAIDIQGGVHKIQYNSGYAYFEDNPRVGFNTSAYFVTDNEIKGPMIDYHVKNDTLICSGDYLYLTISAPGKVCRLGYDENDKFVCEIEMGEKLITNGDIIKKVVKSVCPKLYENIANACIEHERSIKNANVKQDIGTDAADELMQELDQEEMIEKVNIKAGEENLREDIHIVERVQSEMSIDDEIYLLEQDPNVQRYIELMKLQAEQKAMNQDNNMTM